MNRAGKIKVTSTGILVTMAVSAIVLGLLFITISTWLGNYQAHKLASLGGATYSQLCTISLSNASINFGTVLPLSSAPTDKGVIDANLGNANATILVYGTDWLTAGGKNFTSKSTLWSANMSSGAGGVSLSDVPFQDTHISVAPGTNATVYFGLAVPGGVAPGSYSQIIYLVNSC